MRTLPIAYTRHRVTGRIRIRRMQVTLGLIKPTVCAYRPNVLRALRRIQALNSIEVGQKKKKNTY